MYLVVLIAELPWRDILFEGFRFCCGSILIRTTNEKRRATSCFIVSLYNQYHAGDVLSVCVPREYISAQNTPHYIAQMRDVIDIR